MLYITFLFNKSNKFLASLTIKHWEDCKRLLRYLRGTIYFRLQFYHCRNMQSNCFSDLDKVCDGDDRKHVAGYLVYYDPKLVFWSSIVEKSKSFG